VKKRKTLLSDNMIFAKSCKKFKKTSVMKKQYTWRRQPWSSGAFGVRPYCPADVAQRSEFPQEYSLGGKRLLIEKKTGFHSGSICRCFWCGIYLSQRLKQSVDVVVLVVIPGALDSCKQSGRCSGSAVLWRLRHTGRRGDQKEERC